MTAIFVAMGTMQQQVFDGAETETFELRRPLRSHARQIADGRLQRKF